ncbi:MAG TPA: hypothetical protein DCX23_03840 [Lachnospiraceae bacterium]|nr:hypothetical protein [Lachnospiraceae bacterium]
MNMVSKTGKFIISGLGTALLLSLVFMNFVNRAYMPLNSKEHMEYNHVSIPFILFFLVLLILFIVSLRKKFLRYFSPQVVASISALFYLWTGLVLIYRVDPAIRADAKFCFEAAVGFLNNDYSSLERGGYLFENAHQIGFVLYEMLLALISQDIRFVYFINLVLTLVNNLLIVRLTSIMTGENEEAIKLASLLSLLFLPQLYFILFGYNQTISITLMLLSSVMLGRFLRQHGILSMLFMIITAYLAACVRGNASIFIIAECIIILLHYLRRKAAAEKKLRKRSENPDYRYSNEPVPAPRRNRLCLMALILLLTAFVLSGPTMRLAGERVTGQEMPQQLPKHMWIAMGMQGGDLAPGWYNGYIYRTYRNNDYNMALTSEMAKQEISDRIQVFAGNPGLMLFFYSQKIISTWCEPTFESVWSGPLEDMNQHIDGKLLHALYTGGKPYSVYCNYCALINLPLYIGAAIGAFALLTGLVRPRTKNRNKKDRRSKVLSPACLDMLLFPALFLIGGFLFHILWETKSQYAMVYIYMLIPLASFGYAMIYPDSFSL